jgi:hypothetical protein
MKQKLSWILSMAVVAGGAVTITKLVSGAPERRPIAADTSEVTERLQRLEMQLPAIKRSMAQTGAQLGAVALAHAASEAEPSAETPEGKALEAQREAERVVKQSRHYDGLDLLARSGGGAGAVAQLKKNIENARSLPSHANPGELDIANLTCSEALCRVEVRTSANKGSSTAAATQILMRGMGNLSMRPYAPGQPAVYYVATPGHRLPRLEL